MIRDRYPDLWPNAFDSRWENKAIHERDWHFHRRLLERCGIVLAPGEFAAIIRDIKRGTAVQVKKLTSRKAIFWVRIARLHERIYVLSNGQQLFTAYPHTPQLNRLRRAQLDQTGG